MRVLYIDTSSFFLSAGITENGKLLAEVLEKLEHNLSRDAVKKIADMFLSANLTPNDIDKIIVVDGPGSFTGIRVGITIAKIYAYAKNIEITSISSLDAMSVSNDNYNYYVPIIDARRGYVYTGVYDKEYREILEKGHIKLDVLKEKLKDLDNYLIITNDEIDIDGKKITYKPDILKIVEKYKDKNDINPHSVNPNYLKLTEAEENLMKNV